MKVSARSLLTSQTVASPQCHIIYTSADGA